MVVVVRHIQVSAVLIPNCELIYDLAHIDRDCEFGSVNLNCN
jgi:hypothetical protein